MKNHKTTVILKHHDTIQMKVSNLFIKTEKKQPLQARESLQFVAASGIKGDRNAHGASPRQVLVTRVEDFEPFNIKPGELRENVITKGLSLEQFQPGTLLTIGDVKIRLTYQCEPCPTVAHLVDDLKKLNDKRGILGVIISGGEVKVGDKIEVKIRAFPAIEENNFDLFQHFVAHIPEGKIVTYQDAIKGMGGYSAHLKVIPSFIDKLSDTHPVHRIVNTKGEVIEHVDNQTEKLAKEGVKVENGKVNLADYHWSEPGLHLL